MQSLFKFSCLVVASSISFGSTLAQESSQSKFDVLAPQSCWAYSSWRAKETYDPKSENVSERLLAEPAVKKFTEDLVQRIGLLVPAMAETVESLEEETETVKRLRVIGKEFGEAALTRDGCFFIEKMSFDIREGPQNIQAVLIMDLGKNVEGVLESLSGHFKGNSPVAQTIEGVGFKKISLEDPLKTDFFFGAANETLIIGMGERAVTGVLKRRSNKTPPAWLANIKVRNPADRVRGVSYINVEKIREQVVANVGADRALQAFSMLGIGNVTSIDSMTGFTESESFSRTLVRFLGGPEGLFNLASQGGMTSSDLERFPKDSLFAVGVSVEPGQALQFLRLLSLQMSGRDEVGQVIESIKRETGIDIQTELLDLVGSSWTLHNAAGDGWITGLTAIGEVKDPDKLSATIQKLIKKFILLTDGDPGRPIFSRRKVGGDELYTFRVRDQYNPFSFPFEPSWSISGNRLVVGLYPQAVQTAILEPPKEILIDQSEFDFLTQSFSQASGNEKLIGMAYVDAARNFEISYPYAQMALSIGKEAMLRELRLGSGKQEAIAAVLGGIQLPPARSIHKHLEPSWVAIRKTKAGIEFEARQTIPALDAGVIAPVAVGMLLPAVQSVRGDARRIVSQNNLRQLTLAAHNFESAYQYFPAGFSINKDDEKLLSWRVYLLPFLEQNDLFEKFKLDEPWDSPNNKPLAAEMPEFFRSPDSKAKPGMTVYRGIGGKQGILGPPRNYKKRALNKSNVGRTFGNISDGTSNTIFAMEVSDELAVPWTKPDEGIDPEDFDPKKLFGARSQGMTVSLADGSAHLLSDSIDATALKYLMQMADGNVTPDVFNRRSRSQRSRASRAQRAKIQANANQRYGVANGEVILNADNMLSAAEKKELGKRKHLEVIKQVALAMHNFHSAHNKFPGAYSVSREGKPLLSWRVHLLPFLGESRLYDQFKTDEPWDSEHNRKLLAKIPQCYDLSKVPAKLGKTTLMANGGEGGLIVLPEIKPGLSSKRGIGLRKVSDGSSNTLMLMEAPDELAVHWTEPADFAPDPAAIEKMLSDELNIAMADGSTHRISKGFSAETFQKMLTRAGGEMISGLYQQLRNR